MLASCGSTIAGDAVANVTRGEGDFAITEHGSFAKPWAIAVEPGTGNVFITEQAGTMKFVQPANGRLGFVESGLPKVAHGGQGGLGDFAFAPDYATSRRIYLSWAQEAEADTRRAVLGTGKLICEEHDSCRIDGLRVIWQQPAVSGKGHFGHKIAFSPDGQYLFLTSSDRQKMAPAQDLSNNLGSIVRLLPGGTPAPGNPFADVPEYSGDIWSYGHRNILGLQFDVQGKLWGLEHGPKSGDELNLIRKGTNYGWPEASDGVHYNNDPIPDHTPSDGFAAPALQWTPVIAPGDFVIYRGDRWPQWRGQALIAGLKSKAIVRVSLDADANAAREEARYSFPERLRDIAEADDGSLWVIEDSQQGRLLRLTPAG